jgi:hypothetical protein
VHIEPYLSLVDEAAARCSAAGRDELAQYFTLGVEHEWNLADSAWRQQEWPG